MKYWFGYPMKECECGFTTPDEDEFQNHLIRKGHKEKKETKPAKVQKVAKEEENV